MGLTTDPATGTCRVLLDDSELAEAVPSDQRERAIAECVARTTRLFRGRWRADDTTDVNGGIGLLVLDGLLIRRVGVDKRFGAELLGEGDLLRPWQGEEEPHTLSLTTGWRVLQPTRLAVLDEQFARSIAPYPHLAARLVGRALQRSRNLAVNMAIVHHARVDTRVLMLLWHLAGRWGRVSANGIVLPLRLTHTVLADLVAARRPTVSSAIAELVKHELIESNPDSWLLKGEPPGELVELGPVQHLRHLAAKQDNRRPARND
jgi:CRP/FNR family transcriptional regulator, cyclic AMP receptor protein